MTSIIVENLCKSFGDNEVLKAVTAEFESGKIYGLVGRNGSGKSVFLNCIAGLVHSTQGSIVIFGKRIGKDVDFAPDTGIAIEQPGLLLRKSAYANMKSLAALTGKSSAEEIMRLIRLMGLNPSERKAVAKYSMGMKQRLSIAIALLDNPMLLLLDEPMSNLDQNGVEEMRQLFRKLANAGKTVIIATHVQKDVDELCDTIFHFESGTVSQIQIMPRGDVAYQ